MPDPMHVIDSPSPWVCRWAGLIRGGGRVLDVACGRGRHLRYLRSLGFAPVGVDRDESLRGVAGAIAGVEFHAADIEMGPWPFPAGEFDAVVVTNYLHRPIFPRLLEALRPGGVLVVETFAAGNERYGRPSNPDFLLRPGELLELTRPLQPVAFEQGLTLAPKQAVVQRICAVRNGVESRPIDLSSFGPLQNV
jgi:SAM-dependent methyltransferase